MSRIGMGRTQVLFESFPHTGVEAEYDLQLQSRARDIFSQLTRMELENAVHGRKAASHSSVAPSRDTKWQLGMKKLQYIPWQAE